MGTFGTAIFSDDFACDIRDEFKELIGKGMTSEEATKFMIASNSDSLSDEDEGSVFWLSLAAIQWKTGRLLEDVKQKAIEVINTGSDLKRWEDEGDEKLVAKRQRELVKLKEQLLSPQPAQKIIAKVYKEFTSFEVGDVFSYAHSSGKYALFRVIGHFVDNGGRRPTCEILDFFDTKLPTDRETIEKMPFISAKEKDFLGNKMSRFFLGDIKQKFEPKDKVQLIARNIKGMQEDKSPSSLIFWRDLDARLTELFAS
ncbi:hypothetical protein [Paracnuella aquatica]|uniref:hypothetical protein n=1 Tax=Paracnuella aquatica TaxID=2268757 RepID=UPI000DEF9A25|nr:hypothetical protein [Paracnuella aquatica]RPD43427.1 hypothetical protein DRJ53_20180 [Paracnuella aquatica]